MQPVPNTLDHASPMSSDSIRDPDTPPTPVPDAAKRPPSLARDIAQTVFMVIIAYVGLRSFVLPYRVDGSSMTPYLMNGERLFVNRTSYAHLDTNTLWNLLPWEDRHGTADLFPFSAPQRGDIIVLQPPVPSAEPYIKRVIGLPGERITFADGLVFIDGRALTEDYIQGAITFCGRSPFCSTAIPPGAVFVLGDNRANSADSRVFGIVPYDHIIGKAIFSNWPVETLGPIGHPDYELTEPGPR